MAEAAVGAVDEADTEELAVDIAKEGSRSQTKQEEVNSRKSG